jgi:hypothetical protein
MTKRSADILVLCEDLQQFVFVRRFLMANGWDNRRIRANISPFARGSAEQFVREQFPLELKAYRSRSGNMKAALFVVTDADPRREITDRMNDFKASCKDHRIEFRKKNEKVVFVIPKMNIETWFQYLAGESFDEAIDYRHLNRESDCFAFVETLAEMCRNNSMKQPVPPSLEETCKEYKDFQ